MKMGLRHKYLPDFYANTAVQLLILCGNLYGPFPLSDSDIDKYRVSLLSTGLFPPSERNSSSDSDVAIAKFGMGYVPIC